MCQPACKQIDWQDAPANNRPGYIRTVCKKCGRWIGDRPESIKKPGDKLKK